MDVGNVTLLSSAWKTKGLSFGSSDRPTALISVPGHDVQLWDLVDRETKESWVMSRSIEMRSVAKFHEPSGCIFFVERDGSHIRSWKRTDTRALDEMLSTEVPFQVEDILCEKSMSPIILVSKKDGFLKLANISEEGGVSMIASSEASFAIRATEKDGISSSSSSIMWTSVILHGKIPYVCVLCDGKGRSDDAFFLHVLRVTSKSIFLKGTVTLSTKEIETIPGKKLNILDAEIHPTMQSLCILWSSKRWSFHPIGSFEAPKEISLPIFVRDFASDSSAMESPLAFENARVRFLFKQYLCFVLQHRVLLYDFVYGTKHGEVTIGRMTARGKPKELDALVVPEIQSVLVMRDKKIDLINFDAPNVTLASIVGSMPRSQSEFPFQWKTIAPHDAVERDAMRGKELEEKLLKCESEKQALHLLKEFEKQKSHSDGKASDDEDGGDSRMAIEKTTTEPPSSVVLYRPSNFVISSFFQRGFFAILKQWVNRWMIHDVRQLLNPEPAEAGEEILVFKQALERDAFPLVVAMLRRFGNIPCREVLFCIEYSIENSNHELLLSALSSSFGQSEMMHGLPSLSTIHSIRVLELLANALENGTRPSVDICLLWITLLIDSHVSGLLLNKESYEVLYKLKKWVSLNVDASKHLEGLLGCVKHIAEKGILPKEDIMEDYFVEVFDF
eukprot:TRINITY_DN10163_c0_g1_i1.p1 TRINITY_DN10163_c0_g1~~TRINITY_DN10163_c0_g1_i1.p1  ORF type:complete len:674 (+),score=199.44 TRINITY_DN10163_c0_g1_i1:102-2123(+)